MPEGYGIRRRVRAGGEQPGGLPHREPDRLDEVQRWRGTVLTAFLASCDLRLLEKVAELV
jgi:hypothetical protein